MANPNVPIHEAKSTLSQLVHRAKNGEAVYIGARGKAEVVLMAVGPARQLGLLEGTLAVPPDFNDPLPATLRVSIGGQP